MLVAIFLVGCGEQAEDIETRPAQESIVQTKTAERGGKITLQMRNPDTLNPIETNMYSNMLVLDLIYDSLITLDNSFKPMPLLAKSWEYSEDFTRVDMILNDNVTWHDGKQFTSKDVVHTYKELSAMRAHYSDMLGNIKSIQEKGDYGIVVAFNTANQQGVSLLTFPIIPAHLKNIGTQPCGTGMFKFESIDEYVMLLAAFDGWAFGERPFVDSVNVVLTANDENALSTFSTGQISVMDSHLIQPGKVALKHSVTHIKYPTTQLEVMVFGDNATANIQVREALDLVIDRENLVNDAFFGFATPTYLPAHPKYYLNKRQVEEGMYNLEYAKQLLFEAGYTDSDGDGFLDYRENNATHLLEMNLIINEDNQNRVLAASKIVSNAQECGIKVNVLPLEWDQYEASLKNRNYDMALAGIILTNDMKIGQLSAYVGLEQDVADDVYIERYESELPFLSLCFKDGAVYHYKNIAGLEDISVPHIYKTINRWYLGGED